MLWAYARDLFQTPGFGDTIDFVHIKRHYYEVHADINPTRIVPVGPDLSGWITPHGREELGGRPVRRRHAARTARAGRGRRRVPHPAHPGLLETQRGLRFGRRQNGVCESGDQVPSSVP